MTPDAKVVVSIRPEAMSRTWTRESGLVSAFVWTASSLPSGLTATHETGSPSANVRRTDVACVSHSVTCPLVPPVASLRPSGKNAMASAGAPFLAANLSITRWVWRSTNATVPSPRPFARSVP